MAAGCNASLKGCERASEWQKDGILNFSVHLFATLVSLEMPCGCLHIQLDIRDSVCSVIRKAKQNCARLCSCSPAWSIRKGKVLNSRTKVQTPANLPKSKSLICMSPWVSVDSVVQLYLVAVLQFSPFILVRILIRATFQQVGRAQI